MQSGSATSTFNLIEWLTRAAEMRASDCHFHTGYPPLFRINGSMTAMDEALVSQQALVVDLAKILSQENKDKFKQQKDVDFTYELPGIARFRASMFMTHSGVNAAFRVLPPGPTSLEALGLPPALDRFTEFHHGLLLFTGPAGCGKSTTLAAIVNMINEKHSGHHVLTLEDPIEILHTNKGCVINQRQVILHTQSYARAMRAALREDPDIIIIGEMRDAETISLALTAAETGHLVMASMHTTDAVKSISRIIDSFDPDRQSQIRTMLAESLQGVFSQLLIPSADGQERALGYELLFVNSAVSNMIKDKKTFQIPSVMQMGKAQGMCTMAMTVSDLVRSGRITRDVAKRYVDEALL